MKLEARRDESLGLEQYFRYSFNFYHLFYILSFILYLIFIFNIIYFQGGRKACIMVRRPQAAGSKVDWGREIWGFKEWVANAHLKA